jgi:hypothetical protein
MSMSISYHLHKVGLQMVFVVCDDGSKSGVREDDAIKDCMCLLQSLNKGVSRRVWFLFYFYFFEGGS